jgi:indole-3-glycerol phosphate synthase
VTILDEIIAATHATVAARRRTLPRGQLEAADGFARPVLDFEGALREEGVAFIAESKRRSPSKGLLRDPYDPVAIVEGYADAGAAAASILTEPDFFEGAPEHLQAVRAAVPALPLLRKDFVVDEYQLYEARVWGADAVLLIAAALDRVHVRDLQDAAAGLGLHVLLEVHSPFELDRVDFARTRIVGVNHRDLRTFEVNLGRSQEVFAYLPAGIVRVAESGLRTPDDIAEVARHGADAVLVGEAFMREADPGAALRALREGVAERLEV